eukprot:ANDGO_01116.mRNA.1 MAP3K epsilon protein kinase 1
MIKKSSGSGSLRSPSAKERAHASSSIRTLEFARQEQSVSPVHVAAQAGVEEVVAIPEERIHENSDYDSDEDGPFSFRLLNSMIASPKKTEEEDVREFQTSFKSLAVAKERMDSGEYVELEQLYPRGLDAQGNKIVYERSTDPKLCLHAAYRELSEMDQQILAMESILKASPSEKRRRRIDSIYARIDQLNIYINLLAAAVKDWTRYKAVREAVGEKDDRKFDAEYRAMEARRGRREKEIASWSVEIVENMNFENYYSQLKEQVESLAVAGDSNSFDEEKARDEFNHWKRRTIREITEFQGVKGQHRPSAASTESEKAAIHRSNDPSSEMNLNIDVPNGNYPSPPKAFVHPRPTVAPIDITTPEVADVDFNVQNVQVHLSTTSSVSLAPLSGGTPGSKARYCPDTSPYSTPRIVMRQKLTAKQLPRPSFQKSDAISIIDSLDEEIQDAFGDGNNSAIAVAIDDDDDVVNTGTTVDGALIYDDDGKELQADVDKPMDTSGASDESSRSDGLGVMPANRRTVPTRYVESPTNLETHMHSEEPMSLRGSVVAPLLLDRMKSRPQSAMSSRPESAVLSRRGSQQKEQLQLLMRQLKDSVEVFHMNREDDGLDDVPPSESPAIYDSTANHNAAPFTVPVSSLEGPISPSDSVIRKSSGSSSIALSGSEELVFDALIGQGATSRVYRGRILYGADSNHEMPVAIKLIPCADVNDKTKKLMELESFIFQNLHHPNVISYRLCYYDEVEKDFVVVMELADLGSLSSVLDLSLIGRLSENVVRSCIRQTVVGLQYLHEKHLIHRDIKPANLLLTSSGVVKISDFGASSQVLGLQTMQRSVVGTPHYVAPEVVNAEPYSYACDIWSLACTSIELLTGYKTYADEQGFRVFFAIADPSISPIPADMAKFVSPDGLDFIQRCLAREWSQRPSATELLQHPWMQNTLQPSSLMHSLHKEVEFRTEQSFSQ